MLVILLFSFLAQAAFREHDIDPGPPADKRCRLAEMNSCREGHRQRMNEELSAIAAVDEKLRLIAIDQGSLLHEKTSLENESRSAEVTAKMMEREIGGNENSSPPSSIFPGGPSPEEIFFLRGEENSWGELHSTERKARLNTLAGLSRSRAAEIAPLHRNLAMEIAALAEVDASLKQERTQHGQQVNIHARMWESECRQQFCPYD